VILLCVKFEGSTNKAYTIIRRMRYTDRRALIVVSIDGFVRWSWSSEPALKTGRFIRTSRGTVAVPPGSAVGRNEFTAETKAGVDHPAGVWFDEPTREMTFHSDTYDVSYTLLHLGNYGGGYWFAEPRVEDTYERFTGGA
jgi:hypothetical protein